MSTVSADPHIYQPPPRWLACSAPDCGALWAGFDNVPCWVCGGAGRPCGPPWLTSQSGYAPSDFDDPRPVSQEAI
jgi:hypothetical protein